MVTELEKTPVEETIAGEKSLNEASRVATVLVRRQLTTLVRCFGSTKYNIIKYGYETPEQKSFELPENFEVSPTHLTPIYLSWMLGLAMMISFTVLFCSGIQDSCLSNKIISDYKGQF